MAPHLARFGTSRAKPSEKRLRLQFGSRLRNQTILFPEFMFIWTASKGASLQHPLHSAYQRTHAAARAATTFVAGLEFKLGIYNVPFSMAGRLILGLALLAVIGQAVAATNNTVTGTRGAFPLLSHDRGACRVKRAGSVRESSSAHQCYERPHISAARHATHHM